jgi:ribonuclease VapC
VHVLDSSVLIAVLRDETDIEALLPHFSDAVMSTLNHSEVLQKFAQLGGSVDVAEALISGLAVRVVPFDRELSIAAAALWEHTRAHGLSLADRACLALAQATGGVAVTADRAWAKVDLPGLTVKIAR